MSSADIPGQWVVIYCASDDSHVLVQASSVVYDEDLKVGELVNFAYPGYSKLLPGTIRGVAADRSKMVKLQDKLNTDTRPKREPSFNAGRPRKAALKCKEKGFAHQAVISKKKSKEAPVKASAKAVKPKQQPAPASILGKVLSLSSTTPHKSPANQQSDSSSNSDDSDSSSDESVSNTKSSSQPGPAAQSSSQTLDGMDVNDSESNDEPWTEEELLLIKKIYKRKRSQDFQDLLKMTNNKAAPKRLKNDSPKPGSVDSLLMSGDIIDAMADSDGVFIKEDKVNETTAGVIGEDKIVSQTDVNGAVSKNDGDIVDKADDVGEKRDGVISKTDSDKVDKADGVSEKSDSMITGEEGAKHVTETGGLKSTHQDERPASATPKIVSSSPPLLSRKIQKKQKDYIYFKFEGEFFNYKKEDVNDEKRSKDKDTKVVELSDGSNVFLLEKDLKSLKKNALTASSLARGLTRSIFTLEAREICSTSGKPSRMKGQQVPEIRTALAHSGVKAIIEFVQHRAEKRNWKVPTDANVKQYMGNILCEDRAAKLAASQEESLLDGQKENGGDTNNCEEE